MFPSRIPNRVLCTLAVAASGAALSVAGSAGAAPKPSGTAKPRTVTLTAPYQARDVYGCGPQVDLGSGRLFFDSTADGPYGCTFPRGRYGAAYLGSNHGLQSISSFTATLRIDRLEVLVPRDPRLSAYLIARHGPTIVDPPYGYSYGCGLSELLTAADRESITPLTITGRDVTVTCSDTSGWALARRAWAGVELGVGINNVVKLDARVTSIVVRA